MESHWNCLLKAMSICDKVFKNGPSKICGKQPLKNLKGCLSQILLGSFLNTFSHIYVAKIRSTILRKNMSTKFGELVAMVMNQIS